HRLNIRGPSVLLPYHVLRKFCSAELTLLRAAHCRFEWRRYLRDAEFHVQQLEHIPGARLDAVGFCIKDAGRYADGLVGFAIISEGVSAHLLRWHIDPGVI